MDLIRLFKGCVCSSKYKSFLICVRDTKLLHCILLLKLFVTLVRCCASVQYLKVGYGHHHPGGTALGEAIELVGEVYVRLLFPDFESQKGIRGRYLAIMSIKTNKVLGSEIATASSTVCE